MKLLPILVAAALLAASSTAALAQGDCCTSPGQGKDDDNNPSVWGVSPETGNMFGSSNMHHPDMMPDRSGMATAPVAGTPAHRRRTHRAAPHHPARE